MPSKLERFLAKEKEIVAERFSKLGFWEIRGFDSQRKNFPITVSDGYNGKSNLLKH